MRECLKNSMLMKLCVTAAFAWGVAGGCATPKAGVPLTTEFATGDTDAQMEFWHQLTGRAMTSNDDAFHGLLLYVDGQDTSADYAARVTNLKSRGMIPRHFNGAADDAVKRGTLAVAVVRVTDIKGGVTMRLFGPSPRYALRELQSMNLVPPSSENQTVSGSEFVGIIGRLEDYQRGNPAEKPAVKLPSEAADPGPVRE